MAFDIDGEDIAAAAKKQLPDILKMLKDSILSMFSGPWGFLVNLFTGDKLNQAVDDFANKAGDAVMDKAAPEIKIAQSSMISAVTNDGVYQPICEKYNIPANSPVIAQLKSMMKGAVEGFGAPGLENGLPTAAVKKSRETYTQIYTYLAGNKEELKPGALLGKDSKITPEQCEQAAADIAYYLTMTTGDAGFDVAQNVPSHGLVNLLATAQTKLDGNNPKVSAADFVLRLDKGTLNITDAQKEADKVAKTTTTPVDGGKNVTTPTTPTVPAAPGYTSTYTITPSSSS
jgi:hypothetical protein